MTRYSALPFTSRSRVVLGLAPDAVVKRLADPRALDLLGLEVVVQLRDDGLDAHVHPHGFLDRLRTRVAGLAPEGLVEFLDDVLVSANPDPDGRAFISHRVSRAVTRAKVVANRAGESS